MKFNVRDEEGKTFEVEEVTEKDETAAGELPENTPAQTTDAELTPEEIASLKQLASVAPKLIALIPSEGAADEDTAAEGDEDDPDGDDEDESGTVVNTGDCDGTKKTTDSLKKAVGSTEKPTVIDSVEEDTISQAWAKRYGGNR